MFKLRLISLKPPSLLSSKALSVIQSSIHSTPSRRLELLCSPKSEPIHSFVASAATSSAHSPTCRAHKRAELGSASSIPLHFHDIAFVVSSMSAFFYGGPQQQHAQHHPQSMQSLVQSHNYHGGRSRRAPRLSSSQNSNRQFRGAKNMKDVNIEAPSIAAFRARFEAGRSFDLDDDMEFCPNLLTLDEVNYLSHLWRALPPESCYICLIY